jgi:hypothetical protein
MNMANITTAKCDQFKEYIEGLIRKYSSPNQGVDHRRLFPELFEYAASISENYIPPRFIHGENSTRVNSTQFDFNMLMLSMMSISWAVRMRKTKSKEGQCQEHITNCSDARTFHKERYDEWISIVEEALQALRLDPPSGIADKK